METKEQLEAKIKELQAIVNRMPDNKNEVETGYVYWFINDDGKVDMTSHQNTEEDIARDAIGNIFMLREYAESKVEYMKVHKQLKEIAHELNNGVEIDWKNTDALKYAISFDYKRRAIVLDWFQYTKHPNLVYCISNEFLVEVFKRIGKEKIERYLKEGF